LPKNWSSLGVYVRVRCECVLKRLTILLNTLMDWSYCCKWHWNASVKSLKKISYTLGKNQKKIKNQNFVHQILSNLPFAEMKGRIIGAQSNMKSFDFLFGCLLGQLN